MPIPKDPEKARLWKIRQTKTDQIKQKISQSLMGNIPWNKGKKGVQKGKFGKDNPMFGKIPSEEHRRKISESNKGIKRSEEFKKHLSDIRKGKNNVNFGKFGSQCPSWKGGLSFEPYCEKFNREFKNRVRAFFNYQCIECGSPHLPKKRKGLNVHHVNFNKMSCCDGTSALFVPLCPACHSKTNFNRESWERYFTEIIEKYYQGKCYFTRQEMEAISTAQYL